MSQRETPKLARLLLDLDQLHKAVERGDTARHVLMVVRSEVGLGGAMSTLDAGRVGELTSHIDDLEALEQAAALHRNPSTFEAWVRRVFRHSSDPEGVVLATVHKVKGQEWDNVCVYSVIEGLIPHRLAADSLEEERRIMHVAVTRGRREVVVMADGGCPSRFLDEMRGRARQPAARAVQPPRAPRGRGRAASSLAVRASLGDAVTLGGGHSGTVIEILESGITVRLSSGSRLYAAWGERVYYAGRYGALARLSASPDR